MSTGEGKSRVHDEKATTVYKRAPDQGYSLKLKASRAVFSEVNKRCVCVCACTACVPRRVRVRCGGDVHTHMHNAHARTHTQCTHTCARARARTQVPDDAVHAARARDEAVAAGPRGMREPRPAQPVPGAARKGVCCPCA